ncbi:hypothetical protein PENANT_c026G04684 [Penicillium antarcticum]|uniref:Uncharacterized protein n=1 Tax=Penicillium antarcticum TaxID=416450 RepID=A0A1V6PX71_9EURO|nr:hypothetical protein PENANT_c026G04684 [Penicillium antarcticum]
MMLTHLTVMGCLLELTNGHCVLVKRMLIYINKVYHGSIEQSGIFVLGIRELGDALTSSAMLENQLFDFTHTDGLPMVGDGLFPPTAGFGMLINAFDEGLPCYTANKAMRVYLCNGSLVLGGYSSGSEVLTCQIPTPLYKGKNECLMVNYLTDVAECRLVARGANGVNALLILGMERMHLS